MDYHFPFTFLDHKIKVGNALVGAGSVPSVNTPSWPGCATEVIPTTTMASTINAKEWTKALTKMRNEVIKPQLIRQIESSGQQLFLLDEEKQETPSNTIPQSRPRWNRFTSCRSN